jgi:hypothetical protein
MGSSVRALRFAGVVVGASLVLSGTGFIQTAGAANARCIVGLSARPSAPNQATMTGFTCTFSDTDDTIWLKGPETVTTYSGPGTASNAHAEGLTAGGYASGITGSDPVSDGNGGQVAEVVTGSRPSMTAFDAPPPPTPEPTPKTTLTLKPDPTPRRTSDPASTPRPVSTTRQHKAPKPSAPPSEPSASPDPSPMPTASAAPGASPTPTGPTQSVLASDPVPSIAPAPTTRPLASSPQIGMADPTTRPTPSGGRIPAPAPTPSPTPKPAPKTYSMNLYDSHSVRYQDPDYTACVASSTLMMLNFTGADQTGGPAFEWRSTTSYTTQQAILRYERAHMSQIESHPGTDAHGWKNGLNYYGWGDSQADVYVDRAYTSYTAGAKAAIIAMATYHKPVGILAWSGAHAQILNGYKVYGDDPATGSTNFSITGVYITDPLRSDGYRNHYISNATWSGGSSRIRFAWYTYADAPRRDPVDGTIGDVEWYHHWVIVAPLK